MKPAETAPAAGPRDVVILFNTSAGQTGDYRAKGIEALKALLAGLPAGDRVQLMAVDLNADPLTAKFVAPQSKEMADALAALDARVPLGATDMEKALSAAAGRLHRRREESAGGRLHRRRPQRRQSAGHGNISAS